MHILEFPPIFMDLRSLSIMILLLFPTLAKKKKDEKKYCELLEHYMKDIRLACYDVFLENNLKKRTAFFKEPLVRYLWTLFIVYKPEVTIHHLRRTRTHPFEGEDRYLALISDIRNSEIEFNFKIIPDIVRNNDDISLLNF